MKGKNAFLSKVKKEKIKGIIIRTWLWTAVLIIWVIITEFTNIRPIILPTVQSVLQSYIALWNLLPKAIINSILLVLGGYAMGAISGVIASIFMAYSKFLRNSVSSVFNFIRPVPILALIPLFMLWFGIGKISQVMIIIVGVFVIISVGTLEAIRNIPKIYIDAAYTLGANKKHVFITVILPYIFPHMIGALRVGAAAAFGLGVAAELIGSQSGLGFVMVMQGNYLKTDGVISIVIIYSILAFIFDAVICSIEKKLTYWTERRVAKEEFVFYK